MPYYPRNALCSELGCKNPRSQVNSYCLDHGGMKHTNESGDNAYNSQAWKTVRRIQLSKQPLCQSCFTRGHISSAVHVDHVFPWRHIGEHAFLNNIFQSLCHECHSVKTGKERKGTFIHYTSEGEKELTKDDYAYTMATIRGEKFSET